MDLRIPAIDRSIQMQADLLSLTVIRDHAGYPEEADARNQQSSLGVHQTRMLLDAATLAIELGYKRVLWPIQATNADDPSANLDQISTAIDRALLTARLATLDAQSQGGVEVTIETPLVDLTDSQLSDLAADLNIPISSCWWNDQALPDAQEERTRWTKQPTTASMLEHRPQQTSPVLGT
jgi:7-cyano-7-deazaguanine synthase in queuosine biosynthesis